MYYNYGMLVQNYCLFAMLEEPADEEALHQRYLTQ